MCLVTHTTVCVHLSCIRKAAAYCFNATPNNYAKAGPCMWADVCCGPLNEAM